MPYSSPGLLTDGDRWLAKLVRMQRMAIHTATEQTFPFSLTFTIGGAGSPPIAGTSTYTNALLTGAIKVYQNGAQLTQGVDYTNASGSFTLTSPAVFVNTDVWVVLY